MKISGINYVFELALFLFTRNECFQMETFFFFRHYVVRCLLSIEIFQGSRVVTWMMVGWWLGGRL